MVQDNFYNYCLSESARKDQEMDAGRVRWITCHIEQEAKYFQGCIHWCHTRWWKAYPGPPWAFGSTEGVRRWLL